MISCLDSANSRKFLLISLICSWAVLFSNLVLQSANAKTRINQVDGGNFNMTEVYGLSWEQAKLMEEKLTEAERNKKIILSWDSQGSPFRSREPNTTNQLGRDCGSCMVIFCNNSLIKAKETAAVLFNYLVGRSHQMPPKYLRRPDQLYVLQSGESSFLLQRHAVNEYTDSQHFNTTMMLWLDYGIRNKYGDASMALKFAKRKLKSQFSGDIQNILKQKIKLCVAVISNCDRTEGAKLRMRLIRRLENNGLNIDKFGKCFHRKFESQMTFSGELLKYKFYFAFENSFHCKNYITEKFFVNALRNFAIPVVWGPRRKDYEAVAPPNSFIHVDDFGSHREVVEYINYLDKNDSAFLEYFKWTGLDIKEMPNYSSKDSYCQLCRNIHGINVDDVFRPSYNRSQPARPLITDGVSQMQMPPLGELIREIEEQDCLMNADSVIKLNSTLVAV